MAKAEQVPLGHTRITETKERVIPIEPEIPRNERPHVDPWSYMENLKPEQWENHLVYIYRMKDGRSDGTYLMCYPKAISIETVKQAHGGGNFRLILKRGSEIIAGQNFEIEGPPKLNTETAYAPTVVATDANSQMLQMLERLVERLERKNENPLTQSAAADALAIQREGFTQAIATLREVLTRPPDPMGGSMGNMMEKIISALVLPMLTRMMEPKDAFEELKKIKEAAGLLGLAPVGSGGKPDFATTALQMAPSILGSFEKISANWLEAVRVSKPNAPPNPPPRNLAAPPQPAPQPDIGAPPGYGPAPSPPQPTVLSEEQQMQAMTAITITALVNIINDTSQKPEEAADEALNILSRTHPTFIGQALAFGEAVVVAQLGQHPSLTPQGRERLPLVVREFIRLAREDAAAAAATPTPQA